VIFDARTDNSVGFHRTVVILDAPLKRPIDETRRRVGPTGAGVGKAKRGTGTKRTAVRRLKVFRSPRTGQLLRPTT